jgi:2-hydroxychromene-2-carboxylate isomerase
MNGNKQQPLILYWSARSPYSYIALERAIMLAKHHRIPLTIKPVLPMMMRDMNVPDTKKIYIFLDTKREASKLGLPYGYVADPLGVAVERCYSLIEYAKAEGKYHDFLLSFARAVNSEGIRAETDKGMKTIVTRCGLDWGIAQRKLEDKSWRHWADKNLEDMYSVGCWGVPTICYGDTIFWGQDRFGIMENYILLT